MANQSFKIVILGAGTGGIAVAAKLSRELPAESICLVDPAENHYYQPLWTLAGAGVVDKEKTEKKISSLVPSGLNWIKESVISIDPIKKNIQLSHENNVSYEYLVIAAGLKLDWGKIQGLEGHLGTNGICTIYEYDQVDYTNSQIQNFQGGKAVFVMPPVPIKCAGAPQKIMYLAEQIFRKNGVRHKSEIIFATAGKAMFGIPTFANALEKIVKERDIHPYYSHKLTGIDSKNKIAHFNVTNADGTVSQSDIKFDLLHVVPTMSAPAFIYDSNLAFSEGDQKGWLAVDKHTLQHLKHPEIFGIGDVTGIPNSKTGAAIRMQYPIVVKNLISVMKGEKPMTSYNGYSSCPLVTEIGKVMLAEFGYDGKLMPTFPLDPSIPRKSYWHLKKSLLPKLYWYGMMKGIA
ncbi:MAG: FAD/NAD(P)-binding oxidoreductase [Bdellovibrionales bacterium]